MMNPFFRGLLLSFLTLVPLGFGCRKALQSPPRNPSQEAVWPAWIDRPATVSPLAAVGIEAPNALGDLGLQRSAALAQGRAELGRILAARVKGSIASVGQAAAYAGKGTKGGREALTAREDVARVLVDATVQGSRAEVFWTDPKTGTLFVLVVVDASVAKTDVRKDLEGLGLGQEELRGAVERMEQALKDEHP